ncbi:MAG: outer membrane protein assembly factor BamB [Gammaproteobacteria bacterium]|nr:outer membrane protein assembly factor BamB [Gammaproteobacteria bacterium]
MTKRVIKQKIKLSLVVLTSIFVIAGCGDEDEILPNPIPVVEDPKVAYDLLWNKDIGDGIGESLLKLVPSYGYDKLFIADTNGEVSARNVNNGEVIWQVNVKEKISAGVTVANRMAVVATREGEIVALNVEDGSELWRSQLSSEIISPPAVGDGVVVANTVDGKIIAVDAETGTSKWFYDRNLPPLTLRGTSSPVIALGAAIAGFANGKVGVFVIENGRLAWERQVTAPSGRSDLQRLVDVDAQPIVFGSTLYVSSFNGNLLALEVRSGEPLWSRELSSFQDMSIDNQTLLVTHDNGYVSSLNRNNGSLLWTQKALFLRQTTSPVPYEGHIVVGDMGGFLHMLDKSTGKLIGQINVNNHLNISDCYDSEVNCRLHNYEAYGIASQPIVMNDLLIVQTRNGHLIAYKNRKPE